MSAPHTPEQWKSVAETFSTKWNFHNTLGAIDGKHIAIRCPPNAGSLYYNYKGFHSIVLLAVVDGDYKFIYVGIVFIPTKSHCILLYLRRSYKNVPFPSPITLHLIPVVFIWAQSHTFLHQSSLHLPSS